MKSVTHREMRNNSAELLRRVEAGESVMISNHGRPAAIVSPVDRTTMDDLLERGMVRAAICGPESLRSIRRSKSPVTSTEILTDTRGDW